jgi:hypothetical protein
VRPMTMQPDALSRAAGCELLFLKLKYYSFEEVLC